MRLENLLTFPVYNLYFCMFQVTLKEEHETFLHFMTHICAIIGGSTLSGYFTHIHAYVRT